jgi:hypothetical protein
MIRISRAGSMRSPVVVVSRFALKFARNARGRASNLYEAKRERDKTCPALPGDLVSRTGAVQIMRAAKPLTDMMSPDEYTHEGACAFFETIPSKFSFAACSNISCPSPVRCSE